MQQNALPHRADSSLYRLQGDTTHHSWTAKSAALGKLQHDSTSCSQAAELPLSTCCDPPLPRAPSMAVSPEAAAAALAASEASAGPRLVQHTRLRKALRRGDFLPALPGDAPVAAALMACSWRWQRKSIGQHQSCRALGTGSLDPTPIRPGACCRRRQCRRGRPDVCTLTQAEAADESGQPQGCEPVEGLQASAGLDAHFCCLTG